METVVKNKSKDEKIQLKSSLAHLLPIIRHLKTSNKTIIADDLNNNNNNNNNKKNNDNNNNILYFLHM